MLLTEYNEIEREEFLLKKGMKEGMINSICNLMQSMKFTSEQAMKALMIPEDKWPFYNEQIQKRATSG